MTKIGIVDNICERVGFSKKEAVEIVETVFDLIKETLQREDKLVVPGVGNFVIRKKRARRGRNPQTGGDIEIAPRRILTFKVSAVLRASLNRLGDQ
jgi:integration host factor subunit alpha